MTRRQVVKAGIAVAALSAAGMPPALAKGKTAKPMESLGALKDKLDAVAKPFRGTIGYSLHHRKLNEKIDLNGDEPFPTASTIKTAIMVGVMQAVEQGKLDWSKEYPVPAGMDRREAGGPSYYFKDGSAISLGQWVEYMITFSDNTATINLRDLVGMGNVNQWLTDHGFKQTKVLNGPQKVELGLLPLQQQYGLGMTTPNEMRTLFEMIRDNKAGSAASCDRMLRVLSHQYWDDDGASQIPPWIQIAHKTGAIDGTRSEGSYIFAPSGEITLAVYTKDQQDNNWGDNNEGDVAIRTITRMIWQHYESNETWSPPPGAEKLWP